MPIDPHRIKSLPLLGLLTFISFAAFTSAEAFSGARPVAKSISLRNKSATGIRPPPPPADFTTTSKTPSNHIETHKTIANMSSGGSQTAPVKKPRISSFDSLRFFLIAGIVVGHFVSFLKPSDLVLKLTLQHNVLVGAFFVLSGYVTAYTSSELKSYEASPKLFPSPKWILSRVFGYYPLHLLVLLLFSPMFLYADVSYNGWPIALLHGLISVTMTQAWFPNHAEIWNAPTWFLSSLTFATAIMPFSMPALSRMKPSQLTRAGFFIFLAGLLPRLGYCYDHKAWTFMEGTMAPKAMPNLAIFNTQRFNPFYAAIEVLLGAVACRIVMLDGVDDDRPKKSTNALSTLVPLLGMVGIVVLRALGVVELSDLLTRSLIFIPLFLRFLMAMHRASVKEGGVITDPIVKLLNSKLLVWLGNLSFPIFIVHGPIGQLFYKKIIAKKLFGGPMHVVKGPWFFYVYLATVMLSAMVLKSTFMSSKAVKDLSKKSVDKLSQWF